MRGALFTLTAMLGLGGPGPVWSKAELGTQLRDPSSVLTCPCQWEWGRGQERAGKTAVGGMHCKAGERKAGAVRWDAGERSPLCSHSVAQPWAHRDEQGIYARCFVSECLLDGWMNNGDNGNKEGTEPTGWWRGADHAQDKCGSW